MKRVGWNLLFGKGSIKANVSRSNENYSFENILFFFQKRPNNCLRRTKKRIDRKSVFLTYFIIFHNCKLLFPSKSESSYEKKKCYEKKENIGTIDKSLHYRLNFPNFAKSINQQSRNRKSQGSPIASWSHPLHSRAKFEKKSQTLYKLVKFQKNKHPNCLIIEKTKTASLEIRCSIMFPCTADEMRLKKKKREKKKEKKRGGSSSPPGTWKSGNTSRLNADDPRL